MEQLIRMPRLVLLLIVFLPAILGGVQGADAPNTDGNEIGTNQTRISVSQWTIRNGGGHGQGHGHGRGHGHGDAGSGRGRGHGTPETPLAFNPRTIAGSTNGHHRGCAAATDLGRSSTVAACVLLGVAAVPLLRL